MNQFLDRLLGRNQKSAKLAKERMKLVLVHDRVDMTPGEIEEMKDELIEVISRHIEIDSRAVHLPTGRFVAPVHVGGMVRVR